MCYYCGRRAKTTAGLVWGVPVKITELGASLEAFHSCKPAILTLRLCNRYGRGPEGVTPPVTKLPAELVDMIEDSLLEPTRAKALDEWQEDFKCFEEKCDVRSHYTAEELLAIEEDLLDQILDGHDLDDEDEDGHEMVEEMIAEMLWQEGPSDEHDKRKSLWRHRVVQKHPHRRVVDGEEEWVDGPFTKFDEVLKTDFGLQTFITHQVIPEAMKPYINHTTSRWEQHDETTISYLTLPSSWVCEEVNMEDGYQSDGEFHATSTMSSIVNPASLTLTDSQQRRFDRAMKILKLSPFVHPTQLQLKMSPFEKVNKDVKSAGPVPQMKTWKRGFYRKLREEQQRLCDQVKTHAEKLEKQKWPQLINIVCSDYQL